MDTEMMMIEGDKSGEQEGSYKWKQQHMGSEERAATAVNDEITRMKRLPLNSSYASHRLRVLTKIQQLLSVKRTLSEDEELELLFSGLNI